MEKGKIVQILGPVIDVEFETEQLPLIHDALTVVNKGKEVVMEVEQHMGNRTVRCILLAASEGLHKGMEVTATGGPIKVPVGKQTLGRMFNVLGEAIDKGEPVEAEEKWAIHRELDVVHRRANGVCADLGEGHGLGAGFVHLDARALQNRADIQVLAVRTGVDHLGEVGVACTERIGHPQFFECLDGGFRVEHAVDGESR